MSKKKRVLYLALTLAILIFGSWFYFLLPDPLFDCDFAIAVYDRDQRLISAKIATDEQWRFAPGDSLSTKYIEALTLYEDQYFYSHPGINPLSIARAMVQNISEGRIVSGGSTITMQVARLAYGNGERTFLQKVKECFLALRIEASYSKDEILLLYASYAPFGGNVVGIQGACKRFLNKSPTDLSYAEAALLAVLPNNPSLIYPGKNQGELKEKRDTLLEKMAREELFDSLDLALYQAEKIPDSWHQIPSRTPHLLEFLNAQYPGEYHFPTSIDRNLQNEIYAYLKHQKSVLSTVGVHNAGLIVIDNVDNTVLAYHGNLPDLKAGDAPYVDMVQAQRSPGSLLKPFLYASAIDIGMISPRSLLYDIPLNIASYTPDNFSGETEGVVPADECLIRSLNIPFVTLLQEFKTQRFYNALPGLGIESINKGADYYGLSLILGTGESNLWELSNAYAGLAKTLRHYTTESGLYPERHFANIKRQASHPSEGEATRRGNISTSQSPALSAASIYLTLNTLKKVNRPTIHGQLKRHTGAEGIAWKTGTSMGFKDAWAIGIGPDFTVGVWTGNADGEGREGLIGSRVAAPILFEIFGKLRHYKSRQNAAALRDFYPPYDDMYTFPICSESGFTAIPNICPQDSVLLPKNGRYIPLCKYHKKVFTNKEGNYRVYKNCYDGQIEEKILLSLPPHLAYYANKSGFASQSPPPFHPQCRAYSKSEMGIVYPENNTRIKIPEYKRGKRESMLAKAFHSHEKSRLDWFLDGQYLGSSTHRHEYLLNPKSGKHRLTIVDESGRERNSLFEILGD